MAWAVQKAIEVATITYIVTQTKTEEGVDHLSIEQGGIGGLNSTAETHILNRQPVTSSDYIFGEVESKSYWVKTAEVIEQSLRHGWEKDIEEGQCIKIDTKSLKNGWDSQQVFTLLDDGVSCANLEARFMDFLKSRVSATMHVVLW